MRRNSTINKTLNDWLSWQETLHPNSIDLGLERVKLVLDNLKLPQADFIIITVAGTNGKGSCVALLESILLQAGYKVGAYTSPHLLRYNERIRVLGQEVEDKQLCDAFTRIDYARNYARDCARDNAIDQAKERASDPVSLTYFEFGTLAAIDIFSRANLDVVVLEVGLGGRLDAVNILDADIAVLSALDIDHTDWLGTDRESIAWEKAGILRSAKPVVLIDSDVPLSVLEYADKLESPVYRIGHEFGFQQDAQAWSWWSKKTKRNALNYPALRGEKQLHNAAGILMVLELLADTFPVNQQDIRSGLAHVSLPGRFQVIPGSIPDNVQQILDVAHNPQASRNLCETLKKQHCIGKTYAVVGMLRDKDIRGVLEAMLDVVDHWIVVDLNVARGEKAANIENILRDIYSIRGRTGTIGLAQSVTDGRRIALEAANEQDRIVIFGSFITVAEALHHVL